MDIPIGLRFAALETTLSQIASIVSSFQVKKFFIFLSFEVEAEEKFQPRVFCDHLKYFYHHAQKQFHVFRDLFSFLDASFQLNSFVQSEPGRKKTEKISLNFNKLKIHFSSRLYSNETGLCLCIYVEKEKISSLCSARWNHLYFLYAHTITTHGHVWYFWQQQLQQNSQQRTKFVLSFMATSMNSDYKILLLLLQQQTKKHKIILTNKWLLSYACAVEQSREKKSSETINFNQIFMGL